MAKENWQKAALELLVNVTAGVNFTNNLRAAFTNESVLSSLSVLTVCTCNFWKKDIGKDAARLVKCW